MSASQAIGMGTSIIGGELSGWAALEAQQAMKNAYATEAQNQGFNQQYATNAFNAGLKGAGFDAAIRQQQQGMQDRQAAYQQVGQIPLGQGPSQANGFQYNPGQANAYTNMLGSARANLGGYSDWGVQQAINNLSTQRSLDQISNFAGSQAKNVFPMQMYGAQHSWDAVNMLGQAISSIGGGAANYAQTLGGPQQSNAFPTFNDAYGTQWNSGWQNQGGSAEGTSIPG